MTSTINGNNNNINNTDTTTSVANAVPISSIKSSLLKFSVVYTDGGHHSITYRVENMLTNDGTVYCTKKVQLITQLFN